MEWTSGYETETGLVRRLYVLSDVQAVSVYFSVELIVMGSEGSRFSILDIPKLEVSTYSPEFFVYLC